MPWTSVPDKATGDVFTEAMWDTFVRDNLNTGVPVVLANSTLVASAASISFTGINQTFAHLMVVAYLRGDTAAASTTLNLRFNGDAGANYDNQLAFGSAATVGAIETFAATQLRSGTIPANTAGANLFGAQHITIPHYAQASNNKAVSAQSAHKTGTASGNMGVEAHAGFWRSNSAITQVALLPAAGNFVAGSRVTLYGVP